VADDASGNWKRSPPKPSGEPGPRPDSPGSRSRWRRKEQPAAAQSGAEQDAGPAMADLYQAHYRSLLRLAALLVGNATTAEAVVVDSFVAFHRMRKGPQTCADALPQLQRLVIARSRSAARHHPPAGGDWSPVVARLPGSPDRRARTPPFERSAVVLALAALPPAQREAVVLTRYLDLTDEQAAAVMRVSQAALRRHLAAAKSALRPVLPEES
jgi:DNA-directed RNA polymerase specialized sigma24 family protein